MVPNGSGNYYREAIPIHNKALTSFHTRSTLGWFSLVLPLNTEAKRGLMEVPKRVIPAVVGKMQDLLVPVLERFHLEPFH